MSTPIYSQLPEAYSNEPPEVVRDADKLNQTASQLVNDIDTTKQLHTVSVYASAWPNSASTSPLASPYQQPGNHAATSTSPINHEHHGAEKVLNGESSAEASYKRKILLLSVLVGILAAAVVGLAAATGVMVKKANDNLKLSSELALDGATDGGSDDTSGSGTRTVTTTVLVAPIGDSTSSPVPVVPVVDITSGCSDKNEKVSGTTYTTQLYGKVTFALHCNSETRNEPFYAISTPDFETCLDACACWSSVMPTVLGDGYESNLRASCAAAHFVPLWTNKTEALKKNARGNCFLKPNSPTANTAENLKPCSMGSSCHSGIVIQSGKN